MNIPITVTCKNCNKTMYIVSSDPNEFIFDCKNCNYSISIIKQNSSKKYFDYQIIIPFKYLRNAKNKCFDHMLSLVKTAKHLHNNNDFVNSIFYAIIAFEELGKIVVYREYYHRYEGVPRKEIRNLNNHTYKLTKIVNNIEQFLDSLTPERYEEIQKDTQLDEFYSNNTLDKQKEIALQLKEIMLLLNNVKQLALYYDFKEGRTITLKNQISDNNIAHSSLFILELLSFFINSEIVTARYPYNYGSIPLEYNIVTEDPNWIECQNYAKRWQSESHKASIIKFHGTLTEIDLLVKEIKNRGLNIR